jgi:predicted ATPase
MEGKKLLHSIRLRNLLSYGDSTEALPLESLNVLIGPNGSGKSNLIEAVDLLKHTRADLSLKVSRGGGVSEWLWKGAAELPKANIEVTVGHASDLPLSYMLEFGVNGGRMELTGERIQRSDGNLLYSEYSADHPVTAFREGAISHSGISPDAYGPLSQDRRQSILSQIREPERYPEITYLGDTFSRLAIFRFQNLDVESTLRRPQNVDLPKDFLLPDGSNLALLLNDFDLRSLPLRAVKKELKNLNPSFEDLKLNVYGGTVQILAMERGLNSPIPAARLSDGTLRYLCLLAVLCHPNPPPLLCIEEPEIGLHPDILPAVAELLIAASERTQLIVTTHSDTLVSALSETPESVLVCERLKSGTRLKRLDRGRLEEWLEKYSLGDLWRMGEIGGN